MLTGRSVVLRALEDDDGPFLASLANDATVRSHVVGSGWPVAESGQAGWLKHIRGDRSTQRLLIAAPDGTRLGLTGLWDIDLRDGTAESGIKVDPGAASTRKGVGTDALLTMLTWAFQELGLHRVRARILDFNGASIELYTRKLGFKIEGVRREAALRGGRRCDVHLLGLLRSEFEARDDFAEYAARLCTADLTPYPVPADRFTDR